MSKFPQSVAEQDYVTQLYLLREDTVRAATQMLANRLRVTPEASVGSGRIHPRDDADEFKESTVYAMINVPDSTARDGLQVTLLHALPGRMRFHLSAWPTGGQEYIEAIIARVRGVQSVRTNHVTGNVLVYFNTALTDHQTLLDAARVALLLAPSPIHTRVAVGTDPQPADEGPDSIRLVLPMLHLVYSCSPLGVAMHLGEIGWAIKCRHPGRVVLPILHLICSFNPLSLLLHLGELGWALTPFILLPQKIGQSSVVLLAISYAA